jgi:hypothetical protein
MEQLSQMAIADDIARLYQLPLAEFTSARKALEKKAAPADKLQLSLAHKPALPAWAVNQIYWRKRKVFDRLLEAARRLRVEHGRQLAGRQADVSAADRAHQAALKEAADEVRAILAAAGQSDSAPTMTAVIETLQALPGRDDHGRLVKPLKPLGFEALAGLVPGGGAVVTRLSEVPRPAPPPPARRSGRGAGDSDARAADRSRAKADAAARKRADRERRKARAALDRQLRDARAAEREATAEFGRVEMQLARAERERKDLQSRIDDAIVRRDKLAVDLDRARRDRDRAANERERIEALRKT